MMLFTLYKLLAIVANLAILTLYAWEVMKYFSEYHRGQANNEKLVLVITMTVAIILAATAVFI